MFHLYVFSLKTTGSGMRRARRGASMIWQRRWGAPLRTFAQLQNKVKHFRDTVTKYDRTIETNTSWIYSDREKFIIEHFGFLRQAVYKRENARKNSPRKSTPLVSCYFNMYMI